MYPIKDLRRGNRKVLPWHFKFPHKCHASRRINSSCQGGHLVSVDLIIKQDQILRIASFILRKYFFSQIHDGYFSVVTAFGKKVGNSLVTLCFSHQIIKND